MKQNNKKTGLINTINEIIENGRKNEVLQLYTEDEAYNGRTIRINDKELLNFGSCSYLGLELDERLKLAAIEAIKKYGIQYSSSRSYVSCTLYKELEGLVTQIFDAPIVLTPTTTLGHQAVIPVIVGEKDLLILDQQVHASVQYAALGTINKGTSVVVVRHNNMEELEKMILDNRQNYNRIWYLADGIYSMYGDYLPLEKLVGLLDKYPAFNLYVDDAHGMSWSGVKGRGFVLGKMEQHPKMIVGTSFAKAFGTGGGVFIFPDKELAQKVRNCGGPLIFSGPNQIPVLAAGIASARIHLSEEIYEKQKELREKILYCHDLLVKFNLPVVSNPETPIKFIGLGLTRVGYNMVKKMIASGHYCNLAVFPAVPETCTGIRFTITLHHTYADIKSLVGALALNFKKALAEEGRNLNDIKRAFKKVADFTGEEIETLPAPKQAKYRVQYESSIEFIPKVTWDKLLNNGTFDWEWLRFLEKIFTNNIKPEDNWSFHYYIVWENEVPVIATFFTSTVNKDDMLAKAEISEQIEVLRFKDPYYLCSTTFMMGSLVTEGQHLYVDRSRAGWKEALMTLLDSVWNQQIISQANSLCLRDFMEEDKEIEKFLMDQGFLKVALPDNHFIAKTAWRNGEQFGQQFNARQRWYLKDNVLKYYDLFEAEFVREPKEAEIEKWYELYRNVEGRSFELNSFDLPFKFFQKVASHKQSEVMQLRLKSNGEIVAVTFNLVKSNGDYCGVIIGLDYNYLKTHSVYKQMLYRSVIRAGELNSNKVFLGYTASAVKKKFGAKPFPMVAYVQFQDQYSLSVINSMASVSADKKKEKRYENQKAEAQSNLPNNRLVK